MDCVAVVPHDLAADALWLLDSQVNVILRKPGFWNLLALGDLECATCVWILRKPGFWNLLALGDLECATCVWILLPCLVTIVLQHPSVLTMVLINVPANGLSLGCCCSSRQLEGFCLVRDFAVLVTLDWQTLVANLMQVRNA